METHIWSLVLTAIGILGFWLAGQKVWWAWYVNIANQILWFAYALITKQYGFILASIFYTIVFGKNAYQWTVARKEPEQKGIHK